MTVIGPAKQLRRASLIICLLWLPQAAPDAESPDLHACQILDVPQAMSFSRGAYMDAACSGSLPELVSVLILADRAEICCGFRHLQEPLSRSD